MSRLLVFCLGAPLLVAGCGGDGGDPVDPGTGTLVVQTVTTGDPKDPDGYSVSIDNAAEHAVGTDASVEIEGLTAGPHTALLAGLSQECAVTGENPRDVNITAGSSATAYRL